MGRDTKDITIIGAGLGGCALALALAARDIPVTIYERHAPESDGFLSGVLISPNGLQILNKLGVLSRVSARAYKVGGRCIKNDQDETIRKFDSPVHGQHGYQDHRIWRKLLSDEMKKMLDERGVRIVYDSRFEGVEEETAQSVQYKINGISHCSSILIGADGVYSTVRKYLEPDVEPIYTGTLGIAGHIKYSAICWPYKNYEHYCVLQGKPGALFMIPETADGDDLMVGIQSTYPQKSRLEFVDLQDNKEALLDFFQRGYHEWGSTARQLIDQLNANKESLFIWPYLKLPNLSRWYSDSGRVIILGDAAHALPPSSSQGFSQALEDAYSLDILLPSIDAGLPLYRSGADHYIKALGQWQKMRQQRIDYIFDYTDNVMNVERLPEAERQKLILERGTTECRPEGQPYTEWLHYSKTETEIKYALGLV